MLNFQDIGLQTSAFSPAGRKAEENYYYTGEFCCLYAVFVTNCGSVQQICDVLGLDEEIS